MSAFGRLADKISAEADFPFRMSGTRPAAEALGPAFPDVQFLAMLWPSKRCNANELKGFSVRLRVFFGPSSLSEWCHCDDC
jgi:hypothetical protein